MGVCEGQGSGLKVQVEDLADQTVIFKPPARVRVPRFKGMEPASKYHSPRLYPLSPGRNNGVSYGNVFISFLIKDRDQ